MAYGGKRGGAGERVLEGRHVIGLFFLMLLFSGVFFTLGYVMGRNQYDGQVRAASTRLARETPLTAKNDGASKRGGHAAAPETPAADPATPDSSGWGEIYDAGKPKPVEDHLRPAPSPAAAAAHTVPAVSRGAAAAKPSNAAAKTAVSAPAPPRGTYTLQVAALTKESDAVALASTLQKKRFPAFVQTPQADKYFRVQVGPYADQKAAEAARKGLEGAGFKAIVKHG